LFHVRGAAKRCLLSLTKGKKLAWLQGKYQQDVGFLSRQYQNVPTKQFFVWCGSALGTATTN
jgi:hypothetical protein